MKEPRVSLLVPSASDSALSYYGKAILIETQDDIKLQSYDTIVCVFDKTYNSVKIKGWYSMTTGRHIRSFLAYLGVNTEGLLKGANCRSFKQFVEKHPEFTICEGD